MNEVWIAHVDGAHRCYVSPDGITRRYLGCAHAKPRQALLHTAPVFAPARRSDAAVTSPPDREPPSRLDSGGLVTGSPATAASPSTAGDSLGL